MRFGMDALATDCGRPIHPLWLRVTHWLNALAVLVLVTSGWRIYNAAPLYDFLLASGITFGGWLGGALSSCPAALKHGDTANIRYSTDRSSP